MPTRLPRFCQLSRTTGTPGNQCSASVAPLISSRSDATLRSASATRSMMRRPPTVWSPFGSPPKRLFAPPAMIAPIRRRLLALPPSWSSCLVRGAQGRVFCHGHANDAGRRAERGLHPPEDEARELLAGRNETTVGEL